MPINKRKRFKSEEQKNRLCLNLTRLCISGPHSLGYSIDYVCQSDHLVEWSWNSRQINYVLISYSHDIM